MAGIERIRINTKATGRGAWRFNVADKYNDYINRLYNYVFDLEDGIAITECNIDSKLARYDKDFGVDVILTLKTGQTITVQEKVLTTTFDTVTAEFYQNHRDNIPGDWFTLKSDLYFVGYTNPDTNSLRVFILLNWLTVKLMHNSINWRIRENKKDGAQASFKYAYFADFPDECVLAKLDNGIFYVCDYLRTSNE